MSRKKGPGPYRQSRAHRVKNIAGVRKMKFLAKLDPMLILVLVVIFGVVITMTTQAATQSSVSSASAQAVQVQVNAPDGQAIAHRRLDAS
jgi:hypothetical protein